MNGLVFSLLLDSSLDNYTQFFNRCLLTYIGRMFVEVFFYSKKKKSKIMISEKRVCACCFSTPGMNFYDQDNL